MVVKQVFDHSLRESGKRFISSLKASSRYSEGYLASLETSVVMAALYSEEQGWPGVRQIIVYHIEDYLAYLQERTRWFRGADLRRTQEAVQEPHQRPVSPPSPFLQPAGGAGIRGQQPPPADKASQSG